MAPSSHIFRLARPAFQRSANAGFTGFTFRNAAGRRFASGAADAAPEVNIQQSWLKRMWNSPIGFKTVHFWAPVMKWSIVVAGISDLQRPAENLSLTQNGALTATGIIWTRWCMIIKPRNILLATVNGFLAIVGIVQVTRIVMYNKSQKGETVTEQLTEAKEGAIEAGKKLEKKIEGAVKS